MAGPLSTFLGVPQPSFGIRKKKEQKQLLLPQNLGYLFSDVLN
jgi:hypothetical protein